MDAIRVTGHKEKRAFVPPITQPESRVMSEAREEEETAVREGETGGQEESQAGKPEEHAAPGPEEKPRRRAREEGVNGAVVGRKTRRVERSGGEEEEVKEKMKKSREQTTVDDKTTASKFEMLEAVLDYSMSGLIESTKAMLTEVDLMQASMQLKDHRDDQESEGDEACSTALDKESTEEMKNRSEYVVWVQCSKADCGKWRTLNEDVDPSLLPDDWTCENNPDPAFCSCSVPEEQSSMCEEKMFFSNLVPGSLVWAQQDGHPWWPAMIERDPETDDYLEFNKKTDLDPYKCHVTYFGDPVYIDWVLCSNVRNYTDLSEDDVFSMLAFQGLKEKLKDAVCMSKQALELYPQMRLMKFGFWTRYDSDREISEENNITEVLEIFSGKTGKYSDDEDVWPKKQKKCIKKGRDKRQKRARRESEKEGGERLGKRGKKRENGKNLKKKMESRTKVEKQAKNSEDAGLKVTKQEAVADDLMLKEELVKKCFTPLFSRPKKNKPAHKTAKQQIHNQAVPEGTIKGSPDSSHGEEDTDLKVKEEEKDDCGGEDVKRAQRVRDDIKDGEGKEEEIEKNNKDKQSRWNLKRWEYNFSDEDEEGGDDEDGFLDTGLETLGCRRKGADRLSCAGEEELEEEQSDFSLMLLEEE
ncbi:uncharacterized protein [Salminus brasiliensis]|uniref:uncharacterized protein isoform X2 n=1 Tax=Salminus brasiliensis TaxID=930266 RepID=UPI003B82FE83